MRVAKDRTNASMVLISTEYDRHARSSCPNASHMRTDRWLSPVYVQIWLAITFSRCKQLRPAQAFLEGRKHAHALENKMTAKIVAYHGVLVAKGEAFASTTYTCFVEDIHYAQKALL